MNPTSFETSWTEAEQAAFQILCAATGTENGKSAHLGRNPGILNAWHFTCGKISDGGEVFYADDLPSLCLPAYAECVFLHRAKCQCWAMRIAAALPVCNADNTNIAELRIRADGWGEVKETYVQPPNESKELLAWTLRVDFDLVFVTGGKANSSTAAV